MPSKQLDKARITFIIIICSSSSSNNNSGRQVDVRAALMAPTIAAQ